MLLNKIFNSGRKQRILFNLYEVFIMLKLLLLPISLAKLLKYAV